MDALLSAAFWPNFLSAIAGGVVTAIVLLALKVPFLAGGKSEKLVQLADVSKDHEVRLRGLSEQAGQVKEERDAASAKLGERVAVLEKQVETLENEIRTMRAGK